MAGRPKGAWSEKRFREALQSAVSEPASNGQRRLRNIAEKLVVAAEAGEAWAIGMVADRLDGRPAQDVSIDQNITHDLSGLSNTELAERIQRELAALTGGSGEATDQGKLH